MVVGDVIRRLVARTIAQPMSETVERATAPFQYALSTKAGCECVAHVLQGLTDLDDEATVLSIDGISAYDLISRRAMLTALANVDGGEQVLPFVRLFYGAPSVYWWEDNLGTVHEVEQGEGGEQGDALMPLLFSLGQHDALRTVQSSLQREEQLFAFLDDIPRRVQTQKSGSGPHNLGERIVGPRSHLSARRQNQDLEQRWCST